MSSPLVGDDPSSDNPLVDSGTDARNEYDVLDNPVNAIGGIAVLAGAGNPASLVLGAATGQFDNMTGDTVGEAGYNLSKGTAVQTVWDTVNQINDGDWASAVTSGLSVGVDVVGAAMDPIGAVAGQLLGWMLEHVEPLRLVLHQLTGEPNMVEAYGRTWQNVGNSLAGDQAAIVEAFGQETTEWSGEAKMAYVGKLAQALTTMNAAASASFALESASMQMAQVVGAVRTLVRDVLADLAGGLVSAAIQAATVVLAPNAVRTILQRIGSAALKIAEGIADLGVTITRLLALVVELMQSLDEVTQAYRTTAT
ncbi:hypothetical protein [Prauserella rugosa]|uniref:Type VII secretion system (Wss) protein ESAT-6 n=1 Tax=Prauserella rugosa TaxID=43354 RepID=A0A660CEP7_9PSEU|nr:hypothetical protein [Prauserella rugosa]KMS92006.1 hypothetical protein ACZ91_06605 [Streptomyces regensis]TWH21882.1 hypothetical protein JD82_03752 [Prauserella rugosa]